MKVMLIVFAACVVAGCTGLGGEPLIVATLPPDSAAGGQPLAPTGERVQAAEAAANDLGYPVAPPDIALGAQLYAQHCTACHGVGGAGDGELVRTGQVANPRNFRDAAAVREQTPQVYFDVITNGRIENLMPPWAGTLTESERWAVAHYVYTLHYTPEQAALGGELYAAHCAECHGATGTGDGERAAELTRPVGDLTDGLEMITLDDGAIFVMVTEGQGDQMPAFADELSEDERWAVTAFTRTLSLSNAQAVGTLVEATPEATVEPTTLDVSGQVSNGTAGGRVPPDVPVTLYALRQTAQGIEQTRTETSADANGRYTFPAVLVDPAVSYVVSASYRERVFASDLVAGAELIAAPDLPVTVYDLTQDPTVVTIASIDTRVDAVGDGLQVLQSIVFENSSDRVYTNTVALGGSRFASVVVGLPPGAVGLGFPGDPDRFVYQESERVVVDSLPVYPDEDHVIQLSYFIPYTDGAIIEQPVYYNVSGAVRLFLRPDSVTAASSQLDEQPAQEIDGLVYQVYSGAPALAPGDAVRYELTGSALATVREVTAQTGSSLPTLLIVGLIIEAVIIGGLFWVYNRRRLRRRDGTRSPQTDAAVIDALVQRIAALDEQHERGQIDAATYETERAALKARLTELMERTAPDS